MISFDVVAVVIDVAVAVGWILLLLGEKKSGDDEILVLMGIEGDF